MSFRTIRILTLVLTLGSGPATADQFTPGEIWPDDQGKHINAHGGGVLFHEGVYYWFGEHKISGGRGNTAQVGVSCYSSADLYQWENQGIALAVDGNHRSEIAKGCILERPKVIYNSRTRKFVMWFHLEHRGKGYATARSGVAVSDKVTGPYQFRKSHRPNARSWPIGYDPLKTGDSSSSHLKRDYEKGQMARDMTLFVDDDGRAFHIAASEENQTLHISLLTPDYLDFTGKFTRVDPGGNNEAPAICKHDDKYWMITSGCTGWAPNEARSFVADSMAGPWKSLGNPCEGPHPSGGIGPDKTWGGQSTFILPVHDKPGQFIAMFDVWRPKDPIDGRYLWLPVTFRSGRIIVSHPSSWSIPE